MIRFNTLALILVPALLCAGLVNMALAQNFFNKQDALQAFNTSIDDWNLNVLNVQRAGIGTAVGEASEGFGLQIGSNDSVLTVNPHYSTPEKPNFILVSIGYPPRIAADLDRDELEAVIAEAIAQMKPEFEMSANVEEVKGGIGIFTTIRESDTY
jgi:hypothetical protein